MSLNETVAAERVHIAFFGRRNAGKSALVNAFTGQSLSVVSDIKGTTTDPVKKAMELLPIGPVLIIDTPGFDDEGTLGALRVKKTNEILAKTDIAVLVLTDGGMHEDERNFARLCADRKIPLIEVHGKSDLAASRGEGLYVSAKSNEGILALKHRIAEIAGQRENKKRIVGDLISEGDTVLLVTPIDESAPRGRIILPQQQTLRDVLDSGAVAVFTQPNQLSSVLKLMKEPPRMVITDSQVFGTVAKLLPREVPLTSFSILFARYKGELPLLIEGAKALEQLSDGDRVLISEGCTHHRQCGDIGTVKMPAWIKKFSGADIEFDFTSGGEFPEELAKYKLIVHCGGCMLNEAEMKSRMQRAKDTGVKMVNYGIAIAHMNGILERSIEVFQ